MNSQPINQPAVKSMVDEEMAQHTPGPWSIWDEGSDSDPSYVIDAKERHSFIAKTLGNDKANAEFIVRACNAHDELLKELGKLVTWVSKVYKRVAKDDFTQGLIKRQYLDKARAAIKKATTPT